MKEIKNKEDFDKLNIVLDGVKEKLEDIKNNINLYFIDNVENTEREIFELKTQLKNLEFDKSCDKCQLISEQIKKILSIFGEMLFITNRIK